ncbi:cupin [Aureimonas sp. SA4125]|uniref:cupin domain-containing protein n=1 Tax=Aureimonas sp. SA4125 TaxID=2826993 RepID=UPI001CC4B6D8|nr:cupin domain-containing protein [Aureimonas sp. SA4125]BDA84100.1 cupin [Aureimonas sp. SA4125]
MTRHLLTFDLAGLTPDSASPAPEKVTDGAPHNRTWNLEETESGVYAGVWESAPGEWRVDYTEWEFCHIVSGVSVLCEDGAEPVTYRAGDSFVIRPGFKGRWRVVETTVKHYVVKV